MNPAEKGKPADDDAQYIPRVFIGEFLLRCGRYFVLVAVATLGYTLAYYSSEYLQLVKMREVARGIRHGRIVEVRVAAPYDALHWTPPPIALARKLEKGLAAPRRRVLFSAPAPSDLLRVRYSDGFAADVAVRPDGRKLYLFGYDPSGLNNGWQGPDEIFESRMPGLTATGARWMREVGKSNPPPPLVAGDRK